MTTMSLHAVPRRGAVAGEQIRATLLQLRPIVIFYLGTFAVLALLFIIEMIQHPSIDQAQDGPYLITAIPTSLFALLVPFALWRSENPALRAYHWSMPVSRPIHTLMKTAAGWLWLMIGVAIYLTLAIVFLLITGERIHVFEHLWALVIPFTAATVAYLVMSIVVIASDHPLTWAGGIFIAYIVTIMFARSAHIDWLAEPMRVIAIGKLGFWPTVFGSVSRTELHMGDVSNWLEMTAIWGGMGVAGVVSAAYLRKEA